VLTFDYWRTHRDFTQTFDQLMVAVDSNKTYDQAVSNDAEEFMKRRFSEGLKGQKSQELKSSGALYILEETAAAIIAAKEFQATRFYPGPQLNSIRLLREGLIHEAPQGLTQERYVEINLERRGPKIEQDNVPVLSRHIPNAKNNNG
jgi:hypothetical protein